MSTPDESAASQHTRASKSREQVLRFVLEHQRVTIDGYGRLCASRWLALTPASSTTALRLVADGLLAGDGSGGLVLTDAGRAQAAAVAASAPPEAAP